MEQLDDWVWKIGQGGQKIALEEGFGLLKEYITLNKKEPTIKTKFKNMNLGEWLNRTKQRARKGNKKIQEEFKKINISFVSKYKSFNEWLKLLKDYVEKCDKLPARETIFKKFKLGIWINDQKTKYKLQLKGKNGKGKLSQDQIDRLESVDYWKWQK